MTAQPKWKLLSSTDYSAIFEDETGRYDPEMEVAQDCGDNNTFEVFRFGLEKLKVMKGHLVPASWSEDWPWPMEDYVAWFDDSLEAIAASHGTTRDALIQAFTSDEAVRRAWAWECVGNYHGFLNLDGYPLTITQDELDKRWE